MTAREISETVEELRMLAAKEGRAPEESLTILNGASMINQLQRRLMEVEKGFSEVNQALAHTTMKCEKLENDYFAMDQKVVSARKAFLREQEILKSAIDEMGTSEPEGPAKDLALKVLHIYYESAKAKVDIVKDTK